MHKWQMKIIKLCNETYKNVVFFIESFNAFMKYANSKIVCELELPQSNDILFQ